MKTKAKPELSYQDRQQMLNRWIKIETGLAVVVGLIGLFAAAMQVLTR